MGPFASGNRTEPGLTSNRPNTIAQYSNEGWSVARWPTAFNPSYQKCLHTRQLIREVRLKPDTTEEPDPPFLPFPPHQPYPPYLPFLACRVNCTLPPTIV